MVHSLRLHLPGEVKQYLHMLLLCCTAGPATDLQRSWQIMRSPNQWCPSDKGSEADSLREGSLPALGPGRSAQLHAA